MSRPDYVISVLDKETEVSGEIGAAWINNNGVIGIKFNPFIENIPHGDRYAISLFPNDRVEERGDTRDLEEYRRSRKRRSRA